MLSNQMETSVDVILQLDCCEPQPGLVAHKELSSSSAGLPVVVAADLGQCSQQPRKQRLTAVRHSGSSVPSRAATENDCQPNEVKQPEILAVLLRGTSQQVTSTVGAKVARVFAPQLPRAERSTTASSSTLQKGELGTVTCSRAATSYNSSSDSSSSSDDDDDGGLNWGALSLVDAQLHLPAESIEPAPGGSMHMLPQHLFPSGSAPMVTAPGSHISSSLSISTADAELLGRHADLVFAAGNMAAMLQNHLHAQAQQQPKGSGAASVGRGSDAAAMATFAATHRADMRQGITAFERELGMLPKLQVAAKEFAGWFQGLFSPVARQAFHFTAMPWLKAVFIRAAVAACTVAAEAATAPQIMNLQLTAVWGDALGTLVVYTTMPEYTTGVSLASCCGDDDGLAASGLMQAWSKLVMAEAAVRDVHIQMNVNSTLKQLLNLTDSLPADGLQAPPSLACDLSQAAAEFDFSCKVQRCDLSETGSICRSPCLDGMPMQLQPMQLVHLQQACIVAGMQYQVQMPQGLAVLRDVLAGVAAGGQWLTSHLAEALSMGHYGDQTENKSLILPALKVHVPRDQCKRMPQLMRLLMLSLVPEHLWRTGEAACQRGPLQPLTNGASSSSSSSQKGAACTGSFGLQQLLKGMAALSSNTCDCTVEYALLPRMGFSDAGARLLRLHVGQPVDLEMHIMHAVHHLTNTLARAGNQAQQAGQKLEVDAPAAEAAAELCTQLRDAFCKDLKARGCCALSMGTSSNTLLLPVACIISEVRAWSMRERGNDVAVIPVIKGATTWAATSGPADTDGAPTAAAITEPLARAMHDFWYMALDASVLVAESTGGGDGRVGACAQALLEHCVIVLVDA